MKDSKLELVRAVTLDVLSTWLFLGGVSLLILSRWVGSVGREDQWE